MKWGFRKAPFFSAPCVDTFFIFLFLCALCVSIYSVSLQNNFLYDEKYLIAGNPDIKDVSLLPRLFTTEAFYFSPFQTNYYRPLVMLSYAFEYQLWGLKPAGYHLTNILLQTVGGFLLFFLIRLLFNDTPLALASAALFCIHPIYSKVVGIVGNRGYIMDLIFSLASIILLLNYLRYGKGLRYIMSIVLYLCAILCRESALLLPGFMVLCGLALNVDKKKLLKSILPFIIFAGAIIALRSIYMPLQKLSLVQPLTLHQISDFFFILHRYIQQLIIMPYGSGPAFYLGKILQVISSILSLCLYALIVMLIFSKNKKAIFSTLFFIFGSLSILRLSDNIKYYGLITFEGYIYFASVGFMVLLAYLFTKLYAYFPRGATFMMVSVLLYYSGTTVANTMYYKDEETFYKYVLHFEKDNFFARNGLGIVYGEKHMFAQAEREFMSILKKKPTHWLTYVNLGLLYWKKNEPKKAIYVLRQVIELKPKAVVAHDLLGLVYMQQNQDKEAYDSFQRALRINPHYLSALENLAYLFVKTRHYQEALTEFEKILTLDPENITARIGIGVIAVKLGLFEKAEAVFLEALSLDPHSVEALRNLGIVYEKLGKMNDALTMWQRVLRVNPGDEQAKKKIEYLKSKTSH